MRSLAAARLTTLRFAYPRILEICVGAGVAWLIATQVLGHYQPFFAPISVALILGLTIERRGKRAYELAIGVALGIAIADLIVLALGTGTWQLMLVLGLAMSAAVLAGGGIPLVNQAAISGVLVATLPAPDLIDSTHRFMDVIVGCGVALAANAITPVEPVRLIREFLQPLLSRLSGALVDIADALEDRDREGIAVALERSRGLDPAVREMKLAIEGGQESISMAPMRRRFRGRVDRLAVASEPIDLMTRNTRVLARGCQRAIDLEENVPPIVPDAIRDLAAAVASLDRHLAGDPVGSATRESALRAAAKATASLEETSNLSVSVIVGQVRSAATDLLLSLGMTNEEAVEQVRSARERLGI